MGSPRDGLRLDGSHKDLRGAESKRGLGICHYEINISVLAHLV